MLKADYPTSLPALPEGLVAGAASVELLAAKDGALPEWIKIAPRGEVLTRDRRFFNFDPERLVSNFRADGTRLCVDVGHNTELGHFATFRLPQSAGSKTWRRVPTVSTPVSTGYLTTASVKAKDDGKNGKSDE